MIYVPKRTSLAKSVESGGYTNSVEYIHKDVKYYFGGQAEDFSISNFERLYLNINMQKVREGKITFGKDEFGVSVVKILSKGRNVPYTIDYESYTDTKGKNTNYPKRSKKY